MTRCLSCNEKLQGRSDKKFCDDGCRSAYNNLLNSDSNALMRNTNNALRKNRRILEELNPTGKVTLHKNRLLEKGFNFQYLTQVRITKTGSMYRFCYEQGYLPLENDFYLLVKNDLE